MLSSSFTGAAAHRESRTSSLTARIAIRSRGRGVRARYLSALNLNGSEPNGLPPGIRRNARASFATYFERRERFALGYYQLAITSERRVRIQQPVNSYQLIGASSWQLS